MQTSKLWEVSAMLAQVAQQIEELGVPVGECEVLDRIYNTVKDLERECDTITEGAEE